MAATLRPVKHDDRLSVVQHLDELRSRLIICAIALAVAFGVMFWQNHALISILNHPLTSTTTHEQCSKESQLRQALCNQSQQRAGLVKERRAIMALAHSPTQSLPDRRLHAQVAAGLQQQINALPAKSPSPEPITLGVAEPFTQSVVVAGLFALILALPVILYEIYAFIMPAFEVRQKRMITPLLFGVPVLFAAGVLFAYFAVLPAAVGFLQNFNNGSFDVLIRAQPLYKFEATVLLIFGLMFQVPIAMMALSVAHVVKSSFLRKQWRYIVVGIAVVAALLPGVDPVTTVLTMLPLLALYGLSIILVMLVERWQRRRGHEDPEEDPMPDIQEG